MKFFFSEMRVNFSCFHRVAQNKQRICLKIWNKRKIEKWDSSSLNILTKSVFRLHAFFVNSVLSTLSTYEKRNNDDTKDEESNCNNEGFTDRFWSRWRICWYQWLLSFGYVYPFEFRVAKMASTATKEMFRRLGVILNLL